MDFMNKNRNKYHYFFPVKEESIYFTEALWKQISSLKKEKENLVLLCIGTDKITGDCLGPLVGTKLLENNFPFPVYGTLKDPVHAVNLTSILSHLYQKYTHPFFLVIDAAVGPAEKIGYISLSCTSIHPGKGVRRALPPVGDISITGIISEASCTSELELPYTRLYLVNTLADFISRCILDSCTCPQKHFS